MMTVLFVVAAIVAVCLAAYVCALRSRQTDLLKAMELTDRRFDRSDETLLGANKDISRLKQDLKYARDLAKGSAARIGELENPNVHFCEDKFAKFVKDQVSNDGKDRFCRQSGLSASTVNRMASGSRVSVDSVLSVCRYTNVSITQFLEDAGS